MFTILNNAKEYIKYIDKINYYFSTSIIKKIYINE